MSADIILYDKMWLAEYIDRLTYQRNLLSSIEDCLQRNRKKALPELQVDYENILLHIKELEKSLEITEITIKEYLYNVRNAALRLQEQCQEIQLPLLWTVE